MNDDIGLILEERSDSQYILQIYWFGGLSGLRWFGIEGILNLLRNAKPVLLARLGCLEVHAELFTISLFLCELGILLRGIK